MSPLFRIVIILAVLISLDSPASAAAVTGRWLSGDGDGWIVLRLEGDELIGIVAGSPNTREGDPPRLDDRNPDPSLRQRPLDGMIIMRGFRNAGDGRWDGGTIYDPNSGKTYKGTLRLIDANTIKLRGYIGFSLFGRSDTWTRDDP